MTRIELDHLLEKAVAEALGVPLGDRPRRSRRRGRLANSNRAQRSRRA